MYYAVNKDPGFRRPLFAEYFYAKDYVAKFKNQDYSTRNSEKIDIKIYRNI